MDLSLLNLYKDALKLSPTEVQFFMGLIAVPWSFKIVYGFLADNVALRGSKRKGHLLVNALSCACAMAALILFGLRLGKYFITFCVLMSQINMAYSDTVTDALTCQATAKGVKNGSENLNSIAYLF